MLLVLLVTPFIILVICIIYWIKSSTIRIDIVLDLHEVIYCIDKIYEPTGVYTFSEVKDFDLSPCLPEYDNYIESECIITNDPNSVIESLKIFVEELKVNKNTDLTVSYKLTYKGQNIIYVIDNYVVKEIDLSMVIDVIGIGDREFKLMLDFDNLINISPNNVFTDELTAREKLKDLDDTELVWVT